MNMNKKKNLHVRNANIFLSAVKPYKSFFLLVEFF